MAIGWNAMSKIKPTATFRGWQETLAEPIPLFNVSGGIRNHSTVCLDTLIEEGIEIPEIPQDTELAGQCLRVQREGKKG